MKSNKSRKKLQLTKETITALSTDQKIKAQGGYTNTNPTDCATCATWCPCHTIGATDCFSCAPCVSVDTGCYPNCTLPACPT